jgi:putative transposase
MTTEFAHAITVPSSSNCAPLPSGRGVRARVPLMARWPRIVAAGMPMHITQRGNDRIDTFRCDEDFARYHRCLHEVNANAGCTIHAYALMTNHIHLLLTPTSRGSASSLMRRVGCRYVHYFNRRYHRTGTLWEGRFRSSLVESRSYFLQCSRYIDLNPVRAGIVRDAADYKWSSFRCLAHGVPDALVRPHGEYLNLGTTAMDRRAAYQEFCAFAAATREREAIRRATRGNTVFGTDAFADRLEAALQRRVTRGWIGGSRQQRPFSASHELDA